MVFGAALHIDRGGYAIFGLKGALGIHKARAIGGPGSADPTL